MGGNIVSGSFVSLYPEEDLAFMRQGNADKRSGGNPLKYKLVNLIPSKRRIHWSEKQKKRRGKDGGCRAENPLTLIKSVYKSCIATIFYGCVQ